MEQDYMDALHAGRELVKRIVENDAELNDLLVKVKKEFGKNQLALFLKDIDVPCSDNVFNFEHMVHCEVELINEDDNGFAIIPLHVITEGGEYLKILAEVDEEDF